MMKAEPIVYTLQINDKLKIYYEDQHLIVLSKPAGLLSQGEHRGEENLVDWLRGHFGRPYVGLIHRLDRNTSGLMVVAKRTKSAQRLTTALQNGKIVRVYLGWMVGTLLKPVQWSHRLLKNEIKNKVEVVSAGGKPSVLTATPRGFGIWNQTRLTLGEFRLETGRSHQIRVQSSYEGFPLLGDKKYNTSLKTVAEARVKTVMKTAVKRADFPRVALHSFHLEFPHPMSGELLKFEDPLPSDLQLIRVLKSPS